MKYKQYNKKRDDNELEIVQALERAGCVVYRLDQPFDLLVGFAGITHAIEVKNPKGKNRLQKGQVEFFEKWNGRPVEIVTTADEALRVVGLAPSGLQVTTLRQA